MRFQDWLKNFVIGKTELPSLKLSDQYAVHSIRRFIEGEDQVWEIAITYTGRLVVRSGTIEADGVSVQWGKWATMHDIEVPR